MRRFILMYVLLGLSAAALRAEVIQPDEKAPPKPPLLPERSAPTTLKPNDNSRPIERMPLTIDEPDFKARAVFPEQPEPKYDQDTRISKPAGAKSAAWSLPQEEGLPEGSAPADAEPVKEEFSPALAKAIAKEKSGKKAKDAIALYKEVIASEPENAEAHYRLGLAQHRNGETVSSLGSMETALKLNPKNTKYQCDYGLVALHAGYTESALVACQSAAVGSPSNARFQSALGDCLLAVNRVSEAADAYSRAVSLEPHNGDYIHNLGVAHFHAKAYKKAIEIFNEAIRVRPDVSLYYCSRGQAHGNSKGIRESIQDYMMAVKLDRSNAQAHFLLASALSDPDDPTYTSAFEAAEHANKAVQLSQGKNALYLMGLARAMRAGYNYDHAIQFARKAIQIDPRDEYKKELAKFEEMKNIGYK